MNMKERLKQGIFNVFFWTPIWIVTRVLPTRAIDAWLDRRRK